MESVYHVAPSARSVMRKAVLSAKAIIEKKLTVSVSVKKDTKKKKIA